MISSLTSSQIITTYILPIQNSHRPHISRDSSTDGRLIRLLQAQQRHGGSRVLLLLRLVEVRSYIPVRVRYGIPASAPPGLIRVFRVRY